MLPSGPPKLIDTYLAPRVVADLTAVNSAESLLLLASISVIPQFGHTAETMSRSREISPDQPVSVVGSGLVAPFWFSFLKQPLAVVQAASPYWLRYAARSDSAVGSS